MLRGGKIMNEYRKKKLISDSLVSGAKSCDLHQLIRALDNGGDVNAQDHNSPTNEPLLSLAGCSRFHSSNKALQVCKALIERGADVNGTDSEGCTALMATTKAGNIDIVQLLLEASAKVNCQDKEGCTALMAATKAEKINIVQLLLEASAKVNCQDKLGNTALHWAAKGGRDDIASILLLEYNANPEIVNKAGHTVMQVAGLAGAIADRKISKLLTDYKNGFFKATPAFQSSSGKGAVEDPKQTTQRRTRAVAGAQQLAFKQAAHITSRANVEQMTRQIATLQRALDTQQSALADKTRLEEQNQTLRRDLDKERRDKEAAQRESSSRDAEIAGLRENLRDTEALLTNAEGALHQTRQKLQEGNTVLKIPSNDICLTDKKLGGGSYGEVFIAYWRGCPVAVKMLYKALATSQRNIDLLLQEVGIAWRLHHPNIATVCGVTLEVEDAKKKKAWIVMELLQGSMSEVIDSSRQTGVLSLTMREKVDMAHDALCGLDYLHTLARPVLHGDIRPTNIFITLGMRAKLGDLGAARFTDASLSVGLVSPEYTARERLLGLSVPKSKETDLYSMGVSLCELFTGLPPLPADRDDQLHFIDQRIMRLNCIGMVSDDPRARPSAARVLTGMDRVRQTDEYKDCPPRRMVKGQLDGVATVTLI